MIFRHKLVLSSVLTLSVACSGADPEVSPAPDEPEEEPAEEPQDEPDPPSARFLLSLEVEKLPILQGTQEQLRVRVERKHGFVGPVKISAEHLPTGVELEGGTVAADETEISVRLTAPETAPHCLPTQVEFVGKSDDLEDRRSVVVTVYGPPGSVDTSFQSGHVVTPVGPSDAYATAMAAQADGKILVVGKSYDHQGDFAVLRLEQDGKLDQAFGEGGLVITEVGQGADLAQAVVVDDEGRIVVAGSSSSADTGIDFALVRYLPDGTLDASFGDGGRVVTALGTDTDRALSMVLQADGKIVLGGDTNRGTSSTGVDFALCRYQDDGALDASFGEAGCAVQSVAENTGTDSVYALALQEVDGKNYIVAAGGEGDFMLARFDERGELDDSFGDSGSVVGVFGSVIGAARGVAINQAGGIVVGGHVGHDFALAQLTADGSLDADFGEEGKVLTAVSADNWDEAQGLALEDSGSIVVAGWAYEGASSSANTVVVRYQPSGSLDTDFGEAGIVVSEVAAPTKPDQSMALLLSADDRVPAVRLLVAGTAVDSVSKFAVTRLWR